MPPTSFTCRVCGQTGGRELRRRDEIYSRCRHCGCLQKELTFEAYQALEPNYDPGGYLRSNSLEEIQDYLGVDDCRDFLCKHLASDGVSLQGLAFLDIGCGMGAYLVAARDLGMKVRGFEPSKEHGAIAKEVLGLPVENAYFTAEAVGTEQFDFIMLSHVIEHIYDPDSFVRQVLQVLKPGGVLLMVTPNADSFAARLSGSQWPMLDTYDHVTMFTPKAIRQLAPKGIEVTTTTSEYPSEFMATLLSIVRAWFVPRQANRPGAATPEKQGVRRKKSLSAAVLRAALVAASFPFYIAARLMDKRGALVATLTKPALRLN